jgi:hypothetical protein
MTYNNKATTKKWVSRRSKFIDNVDLGSMSVEMRAWMISFRASGAWAAGNCTPKFSREGATTTLSQYSLILYTSIDEDGEDHDEHRRSIQGN